MEWKQIEDYLVSDTGLVKSLTGPLYALQENSAGYLRVGCGKRRRFVHHLVAKAFCSGYFEGAVVNHKDFNKHNNNCNNLEWVTRSENSKHAYNNNRQPGAFKTLYRTYKTSKGILRNVSVLEARKFLGISKGCFYNYLREGKILCVSNDYPEKE